MTGVHKHKKKKQKILFLSLEITLAQQSSALSLDLGFKELIIKMKEKIILKTLDEFLCKNNFKNPPQQASKNENMKG